LPSICLNPPFESNVVPTFLGSVYNFEFATRDPNFPAAYWRSFSSVKLQTVDESIQGVPRAVDESPWRFRQTGRVFRVPRRGHAKLRPRDTVGRVVDVVMVPVNAGVVVAAGDPELAVEALDVVILARRPLAVAIGKHLGPRRPVELPNVVVEGSPALRVAVRSSTDQPKKTVERNQVIDHAALGPLGTGQRCPCDAAIDRLPNVV